ncbi:hypothetical protein TKK_0015995 [Trichogramma kaykai]|uniref:RNA cytidine acetyltransferase n=1 Tax=Trichogramma kaykai TaxID=54128 RepID=A0ABD2W990_9HYME
MLFEDIDCRIKFFIEDGVASGQRTIFAILGSEASEAIVYLNHFLIKSPGFEKTCTNILWCCKKHPDPHKKLINNIKAGKLDTESLSDSESFKVSFKIRYHQYSSSTKVLGSTYDICVLDDFNALTPNLLARTVETVQSGGIVVLLLSSVKNLEQFHTMDMNVHRRFKTESHKKITHRFNKRFLLSLTDCKRCLILDIVKGNEKKKLQLLSETSHNISKKPSKPLIPDTSELDMLKQSLEDTPSVGSIVKCCKTVDQAKALLKLIEVISEKTFKSTISLTAARGRGKSATLGLAIAGSIAFGYSNIFITSPGPENLKTVFEFIFKGFEALNYQENRDYKFIQSTNPEFDNAIIRVDVFREHRQSIQYIHPMDAKGKLTMAELLVIDEAAAIPLPQVKAMLGPYLIFMASTINGYEGTGRSLTLKLIQQLRNQTIQINSDNRAKLMTGRSLIELNLEEPIRYRSGDMIEKWLYDLLCLDSISAAPKISSGCPKPDDCQLYYVNRDTLFSYHKASEHFLQRMIALCVSSHYKNSPNDLQMLADAPAHHLFCLLGPIEPNQKSLPEILVVIQVCLEGNIGKNTIMNGLGRGQRADGDLIPWKVAEQFQNFEFPQLSGARIVRIATHPDYQKMGYGSKAVELLRYYYKMSFLNLDIDNEKESEVQKTKDNKNSLPPLLSKLSERTPEPVDYLGVSFGVTEPLIKFWKRAKFVPIYLRQTANDITGEHTCIMLLNLQEESNNWLDVFWRSFRRRFLILLASAFRDYTPSLALLILTNHNIDTESKTLERFVVDSYFTPYDIQRLEKYGNNKVDYHLIMDLVPSIAHLHFLNLMGNFDFIQEQWSILLCLGLQFKTIDQIAANSKQGAGQILGLFNRIIMKSTKYLTNIISEDVSSKIKELNVKNDTFQVNIQNGTDMYRELDMADEALKKKQKAELKKLESEALQEYAIKGSDKDWSNALNSSKGSKNLLSVKSSEEPVVSEEKSKYSTPDKNLFKKKKGKKRNHSSV